MSPVKTYFKRALPIILLLCNACSPAYNWRLTQVDAQGFSVLLPARPLTQARDVPLLGRPVSMTMTAAEVDGVTFAVGSAELADAAQASAALRELKTVLLNNLGKPVAPTSALPTLPASIDVQALGQPNGAPAGATRMLLAHFAARGRRVYQVLAIGREAALRHAIQQEAVEMFFSSFKFN